MSGTPPISFDRSPISITNVEDLETLPEKELKQIQRGSISLITECETINYSVSWDPLEQSFSAEKTDTPFSPNPLSPLSPLSIEESTHLIQTSPGKFFTPRAARISEILNNRKKEIEPANEPYLPKEEIKSTRPPSESYSPQTGPLEELLFDPTHSSKTTAIIAHSGIEERRHLKTSAFGMITDSSKNREEPPVILLYGTNRSRVALEEKLTEKTPLTSLAKLETIDDYNECIDISAVDFDIINYCYFLQSGRTKTIKDSLNHFKIRQKAAFYPSQTNDQQKINWEVNRVREWTSCLEKNIEEFDFSRKLESSSWVPFVIKNTNLNLLSRDSTFHELFESPIEEEKLERLTTALEPIRDVLQDASNIHSEEALQSTLAKYERLSLHEKELLNGIIGAAFFRKTSKLGLEFAHDQGMSVLFEYNIRGTSNFEELHEVLDAKPYKKTPPKFHSDGFHKFITYSEIHHLERLKAKNVAPNHLLIKNIA